MQELLFTTDLATSFTENYEDDLLEWINYLDGSFDQILAISRKGPRIIDLLNELNIINSSLKNRTMSNGEKGVILTKKEMPGYWKGYMDFHLSEFPGMEIGCGDAMVGGISVGLLNNLNIEKLLRLSIGCATANLYAKAPGKIDQKLVQRFSNEAIIRYLNND